MSVERDASRVRLPDVGVLDEIQNGTVLTGEVPSTGLFNPTDKPASLSKECLKENADGLFRSMVASVRSRGLSLTGRSRLRRR